MASILGFGKHLPERVVTSGELAGLLGGPAAPAAVA